jgi:hypothetical protein
MAWTLRGVPFHVKAFPIAILAAGAAQRRKEVTQAAEKSWTCHSEGRFLPEESAFSFHPA